MRTGQTPGTILIYKNNHKPAVIMKKSVHIRHLVFIPSTLIRNLMAIGKDVWP